MSCRRALQGCQSLKSRKLAAEKLGFGLSPEKGQELGGWKPLELAGYSVWLKRVQSPVLGLGDEDKMS